MVVYNFHVFGTVRINRPFKTNAPLIIDPNAVLALSVAFEGFEPIPRQLAEITQGLRGIQKPEPFFGLTAERLEHWYFLSGGKTLRLFVTITSNHAITYR